MVKIVEIFENLPDNSLLSEEPVANYCNSLKGILEKRKGG